VLRPPSRDRKTAAELIQRYPAVEAALRQGRLCLSTVTELSKVLTPENAADTLPRFYGLSRREAEALAVSIKPVPAVPQRDAAEPLDAERSRLHVNVSRRFLEKLDRAKDALSHAKPGATMEEILEAGLDLVLDRQAKRNGLVAKPRKKVRPKSDRIPAHVKRTVWKRADGRCEYILESGERCGCTDQLEFDHITPRALGGKSTVANTRLACRPHNHLAARLVFGDRVMDRYTRKRGRPGSTAEAPPVSVEPHPSISARRPAPPR
jgi:5-methylcytosine-specific restriction endonuclease McrA